jgi:dynein heavy chain 1
VFYEEELDVPLVLFDEVLDHVLRIDRIFRQPQGHLLLIGVSGAGKTTLSRFVAWMNGLSIFQIKVGLSSIPYVIIYNNLLETIRML